MKNIEQIEKASRLTESNVQPILTPNTFDVLARFSGNTASQTVQVSIANTEDVLSRMSHYVAEKQEDINTLVGVVNWQHKVIDYNSTYAAFLLDQISEDEFEEAAERLAEDQSERSALELVPIIRRILALTGINYTPSDLANMLGCPAENIQEALQALSRNTSHIHKAYE